MRILIRTISGALAYARTGTVGDILVARRESNAAYNGTVLFALNVTQTTLVQGFNLIASGITSNIALITGSSNSLTLQENRLETTVTQPGPSYALLIQNSGTTYANGPLITGNVFLSGNVTTASSVTAAVRLENSSLTMLTIGSFNKIPAPRTNGATFAMVGAIPVSVIAAPGRLHAEL